MASLASILTVVLATAVAAAPSYKCTTFFVPVPVSNISTLVIPFPEFTDSYGSVAFANAATMRNAPLPPITINDTKVTETFSISAEYCTPNHKGAKSHTLQILTHGLGFSKRYWDLRLPSNPHDTQYSYVNTALSAGYSTLAWDRLGCGDSPVVDPYNVLQAQVELAVLIELTTMARTGKIPQVPKPKKIINVGHSWGSELSNALASVAPTVTDGLVLTGYSHQFQYELYFVAATNFRLASENQPARFGNRSSGYITWADKYANQYSFLEYPYFDPAVLEYAEANKYPVTVGEFFTQTALNFSAEAFTGPVLYLAAERDLIFCQSNCPGLFNASSPAVTAFGASSGVEVYIQPNVGHGINLHKNATGAYKVIQSWADKQGF